MSRDLRSLQELTDRPKLCASGVILPSTSAAVSVTEKLDWNKRNFKVSFPTSGLELSQVDTNSDPLEGFLRAQKEFRGLHHLATETQEKALLLSLYFFETSILTRWKLQVWQQYTLSTPVYYQQIFRA